MDFLNYQSVSVMLINIGLTIMNMCNVDFVIWTDLVIVEASP